MTAHKALVQCAGWTRIESSKSVFFKSGTRHYSRIGILHADASLRSNFIEARRIIVTQLGLASADGASI